MINKRYYKASDFVTGAEAAKIMGYSHVNSLYQFIGNGLTPFGEKRGRRYLRSEVEALFQLKMSGQLSKKAA